MEFGLLQPERPRDVIDAVRHGIISAEEARRYFGLDGAQRQRDERPATSFLDRLLWAFFWRWGVVGAVFLAAFGLGISPSPLVWLAFFAAGILLGLWRSRRYGFGPLWRCLGSSGLVAFVAPSFPLVFPFVLCWLFGCNVALPVLAARRRSA